MQILVEPRNLMTHVGLDNAKYLICVHIFGWTTQLDRRLVSVGVDEMREAAKHLGGVLVAKVLRALAIYFMELYSLVDLAPRGF